MTNCVLMWGLGSTSDCGHTPRTKATPIQYVPYFPFTLLYILHVQYTMKGWFTLSHLPVQGGVLNKGKNYSQLYRNWVHSDVRRICSRPIILWDANITVWNYKIAQWFQFLLQRTGPPCGWWSDNFSSNYSPWGDSDVTGHSLVFCSILSFISAEMLANSCV
jgi:hypothetical protein